MEYWYYRPESIYESNKEIEERALIYANLWCEK
jgi:hypothetical protein